LKECPQWFKDKFPEVYKAPQDPIDDEEDAKQGERTDCESDEN
jgi:hypothetical protein